MGLSRGMMAKGGAVLAALALVLSPASAAQKGAKKRALGSVTLSGVGGGIGSFTPAAADPRTAALLARSGLSSATGFRFTPSATSENRRPLNIVVRSRSTAQGARSRALDTPAVSAQAVAETTTLEPIVYNLGASIGWKRFAVGGEFSRVESNLIPGRRELVDLGVSYGGKRWSTRIALNADRSVGNDTAIDSEDSYSLDLGGSFVAARGVEVTGGLRYKTQRERLDLLSDDRRDSQAVYIGTAFRF